jgi:alpha-beta hydrolase superfamily lysophospholipase
MGSLLLQTVRPILLLLALGILCAITLLSFAYGQEEVLFLADDGVMVFADYYSAHAERPRAVIVSFHQAGSNSAEYPTIAPRLLEDGFEVMAVDLRLGGCKFGETNRTMAGLTGPVMSFAAVLPDMRAAIAYVQRKRPTVPTIVWGSSYSAGLVIALASERLPSVSAVLAFSPVDLLGEGEVIYQATLVNVPAFITYAPADGERNLAKSIADAMAPSLAMLDEPVIGIHGSMTFDPQLNPAGAQDRWNSVSSFLARVAQ